MIITPKRNIIRRNKVEIRRNSEELTFKRTSACKYQFPVEENVPAGYYVSRIEEIHRSVTKNGEASYDVCYKIADLSMCYKKANNLLGDNEKLTYYYIKQRYVYDSDFDYEFVEAMYNAGAEDSFSASDVIGITEKISLIYKVDGGLGSIDKRIPISRKDLVAEYKKLKSQYCEYDDEYTDYV